MLILADVFMLLSCPGCHGIQYFNFCGINEKKKGLARHLFATQLHCLLFIQYSHTFVTMKQIDLSKKNEEQQKLYDVNVRAIYGCRQAGRHWRLMKKRQIWQAICNSVVLLVYKVTHFSPPNIDLSKKNKGRPKVYDVHVRAIYRCREVRIHQKLMKKRKVWLDIYNSNTLFVYIATYFSPRNRLIYRRRKKDDTNFIMCLLELFIDVDKLVLVMKI